MGKYIDADKVLKELHLNHKDVIYIDKNDTAKRIEKIQGIDIVRCKDCKYISIYEDETSFYYCALECRPNRQWSVDETDYCSWGERKESE